MDKNDLMMCTIVAPFGLVGCTIATFSVTGFTSGGITLVCFLWFTMGCLLAREWIKFKKKWK